MKFILPDYLLFFVKIHTMKYLTLSDSSFFIKGVIFLFAIFLSGCGNDAVVIASKKDLQNVQCMSLVVFPPDELLIKTAKSLYRFDDNCSYKLSLSKKSGITCNSSYNADRKNLSSFPSAYIRMELSKGDRVIFSYYKDLTGDVDEDDVEDAFEALKEKLKD